MSSGTSPALHYNSDGEVEALPDTNDVGDLLEDTQQGQQEDPYYWEEDREEPPPAMTQIRHNIHWVGRNVYRGMEYVGDVLVDFLGLNQSKYQWVIDMHEAEEMEKAKMREAERLRRRLRAARGEPVEEKDVETPVAKDTESPLSGMEASPLTVNTGASRKQRSSKRRTPASSTAAAEHSDAVSPTTAAAMTPAQQHPAPSATSAAEDSKAEAHPVTADEAGRPEL